MPLITASKLRVAYGDMDIFSDVSLEIADQARTGIVGPNGGGKTSLLRVLVGDQEPNGGQVYRSAGLRIGYVPQTTQPVTSGTIKDEVMVAFEEMLSLEGAIADSALEVQRADAGSRHHAERRYASQLERYEVLGGYDYQNRMERVAAGVGLTASTLDNPAASASGGERTRAALARALLTDPDLLVLDEPTNYLDFKGLTWLETFLQRSGHAFIVTSHDRYFLDAVAERIWELDQGRLHTYPGNYSTYRVLKAERVVRHLKEYERQQEFIAKEQSVIDRNRAGQRAREARGRETRLARLERIERPHVRERGMRVEDRAVSRGPRVVVSASDLQVGIAMDGKQVELLSVPDLTLERASCTAIIGSNGTGKTTLLQTILGERPALAGSVSVGPGVKVGYHRQGSDDMPDSGTVLEAMQDVRNIPPVDERTYLAAFMFHGEDVFKDVSALSGGERTRLAVARLMATDHNFLVLDEPTTHLDIPSREALEEALQDYAGTLLVVSHDRHLISLLARQLLIVEDGSAHLFAGTFEEWAAQTGLSPARSSRSEAKESPARRRVGTTRKKAKSGQKTRAGPAREPEPDHEQAIADLESRLARIERELQAASERQDMREIARLGQEHERTRAELERVWDDWQP